MAQPLQKHIIALCCRKCLLEITVSCDHILHLLELDPDGTHVALGGDLDGISDTPDGFDGVQDFPKLAQRLLERGLDEKTVENIFWNNALGVI